MVESAKKHWYEKLPHPYILLFLIVVFVAILTYIIPAGVYDRVKDAASGRVVVDPASYHAVPATPVTLMQFLTSIPRGIVNAGIVVVITFISGAMFAVLQATGAIEQGVGFAVKKIGVSNYKKLIWVVMLIFGFLGATVGFENNIAVTPIAVFVALALGGDAMVGAGMAIAGIGIGFATSPINPYTVGTAHAIAQLPIYSGFAYRSLYCFLAIVLTGFHVTGYMDKILKDPSKSLVPDVDTTGLTLTKPIEEYELSGRDKAVLAVFILGLAFTIFGVLTWGWYLNEMAGLFLLIGVIGAAVGGIRPNKMVDIMIKGAQSVAGGALAIGVALAIQVVMKDGNITDAVIHGLVEPLKGFGVHASAVLMSLAHCVINFLIPSGSGQALATMPVMIPLSDLVGMTRQVSVMAFQIGDGVTNLCYPTLGGMLAMLALTRVPFDRWFRFVFPLVIKVVILGWIMMVIASMYPEAVGWGNPPELAKQLADLAAAVK